MLPFKKEKRCTSLIIAVWFALNTCKAFLLGNTAIFSNMSWYHTLSTYIHMPLTIEFVFVFNIIVIFINSIKYYHAVKRERCLGTGFSWIRSSSWPHSSRSCLQAHLDLSLHEEAQGAKVHDPPLARIGHEHIVGPLFLMFFISYLLRHVRPTWLLY